MVIMAERSERKGEEMSSNKRLLKGGQLLKGGLVIVPHLEKPTNVDPDMTKFVTSSAAHPHVLPLARDFVHYLNMIQALVL
jgi:hypothetical protein